MKRIAMTLGSSLMLLLAGCGGTSTFSCDLTSTTEDICIDYDAVSGPTDEVRSNCTRAGGTLGTTCTRMGIIGGCRRTAPAGESGTQTIWYYSRTTQEVMQSCTSSGTTFVSPP